MAQVALVEAQIKDGQTLLDRLFHEKVEVTAAGWVKESDIEEWRLYIATPLVTENDATTKAYKRVLGIIRTMEEEEGFSLEPYGIRAIGPHDPIATDMLAKRKSRPAGPPTHYVGFRLGNLYIDEAFIYPPSPTADESAGIRLWESGDTELRPGIGPAGLCRAVLIDAKTQTVAEKKTYRGTMADVKTLNDNEIEVTWAEGGAVRIVGANNGQHWRWSQPLARWENGKCPPDEILQAVFTAMA